MTWKRVVALEMFLTVAFAVLFTLGLAMIVIGAQGGAALGDVVSVGVLGVMAAVSQRLLRQARRHVVAGDREPTDLKDLLVRLNSESDETTREAKRANAVRVRDLRNVAPSPEHEVGTLEVLRLHRNADSLANYEIWIDGQISDEVSDDASVDIKLVAGMHTVQVRIAWCRSRRQIVEISPSIRSAMVCHSLANRLNVLLLGTLGYRRYISLSAAQRIPE